MNNNSRFLNNLKIAIVYDKLNKFGGAERVLLVLKELFPKAVFFTSFKDNQQEFVKKNFSKSEVSFLQKITNLTVKNEILSPLMPMAFESFNFDNFDLVISVTSEFSKCILTKPNTLHVNYLLTPTRYLWSGFSNYLNNPLLNILLNPLIIYLKKFDLIASSRPDKIISISKEVQKRCLKYYQRSSEVIYPPSSINTKLLNKNLSQRNLKSNQVLQKHNLKPKDYYLIVSRLVGYKKIDLAVEAFKKMQGKKLVIVGDGLQKLFLQFKAKSFLKKKNIFFLGFVNDYQLFNLYQNAKALIMPQEEDFGITSLEAQFLKTPVIAYNKGGSSETVINLKTGVLFNKQNVASLIKAIAKIEKISFNHNYLTKNAQRFSENRFRRELQRSLVRSYSSWRRGNKTLA